MTHGDYVNNHRHMLHLLDGLKPSYRRMIWTGLEHPDRLIKVATLTGVCGGKYSPHSPDSLPAVVSEMVHAGIFTGQGSHGSSNIYKPLSIEPAASRYIEAKLSPSFRKMISGLIKHVPYKESELSSMYKEPLYIPTPVPLSCTYGSLGLGIGVRAKIPNFSAKSMLEAYEKNDPNLLKSNTDLPINLEKSDLKSIWEKGRGTVTYEFFIEKDYKLEKRVGFLLYGDSRFVQLSNLGKKLFKKSKKKDPGPEDLGWVESGLVEMIDLSSKSSGNKLFFCTKKTRAKNKVTDEELLKELELIKYHSESYCLSVTNGKTTKTTPLKEWIKATNDNFNSLVDSHKKEELSKLELKTKVIKNSKSIAQYVIKNPKAKVPEISKDLKLEEEVVSETLKKSMSVLLKSNESKEIKVIRESIKNIKNLKPSDFYEDFINR